MKMKNLLVIVVICVSTSMTWAKNDGNWKAGFELGTPQFKSIKTITFGPENILFVGDNTGMTVYAIDVNDTQRSIKLSDLNINNITVKIAAALGAVSSEVKIHDMAVNPKSKNVFFAVSRENGSKTMSALFRLSGDGLKEFPLDNVSFSEMAIKNASTATTTSWGRPTRSYTITDLQYANGEVFISGLSNEEFASSLRRMPFPFEKEMVTTNMQVYHVTHGQNETEAPIFRFLPIQLQNEWHIVAGYACTPLVTFKMDQLNGNKKLIGKTVAEIGSGNAPTGIISYNYAGADHILVGNNKHSLVKISGRDLFNAKALNSPSRERGVKRKSYKIGRIAQLADYNDEQVLVMTRSADRKVFHLKTVAKSDI
jgi:hypothetical protein